MARQVRWSHEAATDLEAIAEYISKDSAYYAAAFVTVRELFVKGYRLLYKIGDDAVLVLGVIHGRRDLGRARE